MKKSDYRHWQNALKDTERQPAYRLIADLIASDIDSGLLQARDRLPTLRELAALLQLNYTTVARAYNEARSRGLIDSHPGTGTYIKGKTSSLALRSGSNIEMTMNLPPEPVTPSMVAKIKTGFRDMAEETDLYTLFRYQDFGGSVQDKEAGVHLLSSVIDTPQVDRVLVCPGIHSVLVGLLSLLVTDGSALCVQNLVYPGLKAIASELGVKLFAVDSDSDGPLIRPLEELCKKEKIAAIYVNPTLQNPTTYTMSRARREAIADVALRYSIPIIEDDAYAIVPETKVPAIANLAPELTYYVTGLAKCFGAGLRVAYLHAPSKILAQRTAGALRALSVMASPVTNALATRWLMDGSVDDMTREIRRECRARQAIAKRYLSPFKYHAHMDGFHLWLNLPKTIDANPSVVAAHLRSQNVSVVSSAAFCTDNNPPHAVRICLGGSLNQNDCEEAMTLVADICEHPSHMTSVVL